MLHKLGKKILTVSTSMAILLIASPLVFAAEAIPAVDSNSKALFTLAAMLGAGLAMGIGAVGAALGIGSIGNAACNAVGRNPGVQGKIMMTMLVGMAMAESIAIYCLVIALVLLYANPYMRYFLG
jgi:F-type H+-transporting ATPase subunit c